MVQSFQAKNKFYILLTILIFNLALLLFIFIYADNFQHRTTKNIKFFNINFDSNSPDPQLSSIKQFIERDFSDLKEINIKFNMKVYSIFNYNNVFQTAPNNFGIRMELSLPTSLGLVIGNRNEAGLIGYRLTNSLQLNKGYSVHISIDRYSHLRILLDNVSVVDLKEASINYFISEIAIGTGFSKMRPFDGKITDFGIEYSYYHANPLRSKIVIVGKILLALILTYFSIKFLQEVGPFLTENFNRIGKTISGDKENEIKFIGSIILVGFVLSVFYHYFLSAYMGLNYPYNTFLMRPHDQFSDFFNFLKPCTNYNPYLDNAVDYQLLPSTYPPFAYFVGHIFTLFNEKVSFFLLVLLFLLFLSRSAYKIFQFKDGKETLLHVFMFSFLTYPVLFSIDRGNMELLTFIFLCSAVFYYKEEDYVLSILFMSCAISMKISPAIFLMLFIADKKYKEIIFILLFLVAFNILPMALSNDGLMENFKAFKTHCSRYHEVYEIGNEGMYFSHSLFNLLKVFLKIMGKMKLLPLFMNPYLVIVFSLFGLLSVYIIMIEKVFWKKVTILVLAMNLFPYVSGDYKLLHMYIPLFLFLRRECKLAVDIFYLILFGLLLIPKAYYHFSFLPESNIAIVLNPLIMIVMMSIIIKQGLKAKATNN